MKDIKVLTLWQPWATMFAAGIKQYETRPAATSHVGTYLIHAAKRFPKEARELCGTEPFKTELARLGYASWRDLPTGALVGAYEQEKCESINSNYRVSADLAAKMNWFNLHTLTSKEAIFGDYNDGRFVWSGKNHRFFKIPIPYTNGQGYYLPYKVDKIQDKANSFALIDRIGGMLREETQQQIEEIYEMAAAMNPALKKKVMDSNQKAIIIGHPHITEYQLSARLADGEHIVIFPYENVEVPPKTIGVKLQEEMNITLRPRPKLDFTTSQMIGFEPGHRKRKKEKQRNNRFSQRKFRSLTNGK